MTKKQADYQALSAELEEVISELQHPDVQVDAAVALYERGLGLVRQLETKLQQAEHTLERIKLQDSNGS